MNEMCGVFSPFFGRKKTEILSLKMRREDHKGIPSITKRVKKWMKSDNKAHLLKIQDA